MIARVFLDTNVVAYSLTDDENKKAIAEGLLSNRPWVSVQVINELVNVCIRKFGFSHEAALSAGRMVMRLCEVASMEAQDVEQAFQISERFRFSHWDSLILAVALRHGCETVFSENMQHGQKVGVGLRIINPFIR
ncbi:MAG: PIN domain-containing protein [Proteobacteria bacterium]|nr:PIN domain-containing protein [Pseudomonadota bacterium]